MAIKSKAQQRYMFSQGAQSKDQFSPDMQQSKTSLGIPERAKPKGTYRNKPIKGFKKKSGSPLPGPLTSFGD